MEAKEGASRPMNYIITICAFGCSVDSLKDPENEFFISGKKLMDMNNILGFVKFFGIRLIPSVMKFFDIQLFDKRLHWAAMRQASVAVAYTSVT